MQGGPAWSQELRSMTPLGPFQPSECLSPAVGGAVACATSLKGRGEAFSCGCFPLILHPSQFLQSKAGCCWSPGAALGGARPTWIPMEEPWELLGVLGPMSLQSDSNVVWGFEALEAKKVRTDFYLISSSLGKAYCLTEMGIASPVLPLKALRAACVSSQKLLQYPVVLGSSISRLKS